MISNYLKNAKINFIAILAFFIIAFLLAGTANADSETYYFITKWGTYGAGDGQFHGTWGIAVDPLGNIYVADDYNYGAFFQPDRGYNRIQKFDSNGNFITKRGSSGSRDGQFSFTRGIAVDSSGYVYVADNGNSRIQKFSKNQAVYIDKTPPTTSIVPSGTLGNNDWYISDVTVELIATDNLSGVAKTEYSLDSGTTWQLYTNPFVLSEEGATTVLARSTDNALNLEDPPVSKTFKIDKTAPQTSIAVGDPNYEINPTYVVSTTEFSLSATDNLSGVILTEYKIDSGNWITYTSPFMVSQEGNHTISYRSTDKAGNVEATQTLTIKVLTNTPGRIVGGGGYNTSIFNFNIFSNGKYPIGTFYYSDRLRGINIWSNVITNLMVFPDKKKAVFIGNIRINGVVSIQQAFLFIQRNFAYGQYPDLSLN